MASKPPINCDDAERYLKEIVLPTIADFEANPTSRRHGFLAAVATFHTLDYMYGKGAKENKRNEFRKASPAFSLIDRVAHAFKHMKSDGNENDANNRPLNAEGVISRPPAIPGKFAIGLSRIGDGVGGITISDQVNIDLLVAVRDTVEFLQSQWKKP